MRGKKAQSAMEFLSTYGWVLLILLATLGILMKYGFLEPGKYLPEKVEFGDQLVAEEYFMDMDANGDGSNSDKVVAIKLRNNFPRDIKILNLTDSGLTVSKDSGVQSLCWNDEVIIASGKSEIIACFMPSIDLTERTKNKLNFQVKFMRVDGTKEHIIFGTIYAEPVSGEYCTLEDEDGNNIYELDHNSLTGQCVP